MNAYFSSKFKKQIYAAFTASLLVFCLLGTHWVGFSHSISHAHLQSQSEASLIATKAPATATHSSDVCHLFDTLTLAGFLVASPANLVGFSKYGDQTNQPEFSLISLDFIKRYQSRAPPALS